MRRALLVAALLLVAGIALVRVVLEPPAVLSQGSASALITRELKLAPEDAPCPKPGFTSTPQFCRARYVFAPGREVEVWLSVRNAGSVALTVDGVDEWLRTLPPDLLVRPFAVLDGGPVSNGFTGQGIAFAPITLAPGEERLIGLRMRTAEAMESACLKWMPGIGIGFDAVPVTWHWLAFSRTSTIALPRGIEVMAPTASDCSAAR
jgi:hypothetical protein